VHARLLRIWNWRPGSFITISVGNVLGVPDDPRYFRAVLAGGPGL
jgi:hypothetical protein